MPYVVLVAIAVVLVVAHTTSYTTLGPIDELEHFDYAEKLSNLRFPRFPETVGQRPLAAMACRGFDAKFALTATCGQPSYPPAAFPEGGLSYEALQPPLYYALVGFPGRALAELPAADQVA